MNVSGFDIIFELTTIGSMLLIVTNFFDLILANLGSDSSALGTLSKRSFFQLDILRSNAILFAELLEHSLLAHTKQKAFWNKSIGPCPTSDIHSFKKSGLFIIRFSHSLG